MSEVDTSAKAVKRWTVVRNNSGLGYSDGIAPDKYGGFVDYEAYRTLAAERDALRAQLAAAQAQVQTARKQDVKIVVKLMAKYAAEKGSTKTPAGRTALFYGRKMSDAILALIDKEPTP